MPFGPTSDASPGRFRRDAGYCSGRGQSVGARDPEDPRLCRYRARPSIRAETTRKVGGEMTQKMRQKLKRRLSQPVPIAKADRGAGVRADQASTRISTTPAARLLRQCRQSGRWICTAHNIAVPSPRRSEGYLSQILTPSRRYLDGLLVGAYPVDAVIPKVMAADRHALSLAFGWM